VRWTEWGFFNGRLGGARVGVRSLARSRGALEGPRAPQPTLTLIQHLSGNANAAAIGDAFEPGGPELTFESYSSMSPVGGGRDIIA
jgi:hypothetical protein